MPGSPRNRAKGEPPHDFGFSHFAGSDERHSDDIDIGHVLVLWCLLLMPFLAVGALVLCALGYVGRIALAVL